MTCLAAVLWLGCAPPHVPLNRASPADEVAQVLALEDETYAAIQAKDAARLERLLTDDFVYRAPGQPDLDRAAFLRGVAALRVVIVELRGEGVKAALHGESAMVTGVQRARVRLDDGTEVETTTAFSDLFVRRDGRWWLAVAFGVESPPGTGQ